jgi:hypothetical protein
MSSLLVVFIKFLKLLHRLETNLTFIITVQNNCRPLCWLLLWFAIESLNRFFGAFEPVLLPEDEFMNFIVLFYTFDSLVIELKLELFDLIFHLPDVVLEFSLIAKLLCELLIGLFFL